MGNTARNQNRDFEQAVKAFEERGLDIELAGRMGCRFEKGKFLFEYTDRDVLQFTKYRSKSADPSKDKIFWIEPKGARLQLWNLDGLRGLPSMPTEPLVITEGEPDAVAVVQACGGYVTSVPNGSNGQRSTGTVMVQNDRSYSYLWGEDEHLIPEITQFDKVILAVDSDDPGVILRDELAMRIGPTKCWFVVYPDGCKDPNDVLRLYGAETLQRVIQNAKPMKPGHLIKPSDLPPSAPQMAYSTGWSAFDRHLMLIRPELMVVTGIPGHGKTAWIRALMFNLAVAHGWRTAFVTPEDPLHRLKREMTKFARYRVQDRPEGQSVDDWMDAHFRLSNPPEDESMTIEFIKNEMATAALHHSCQAFVIDPWNEISHDFGRRSETKYIEDMLVELKRHARRYNLLLIIMAHPTKVDEGKPNLYSISGSANWKNKCDHGIIIYRPSLLSKKVEVIIEKCKDNETMGMPGNRYMNFLRDHGDFVDAGDATNGGNH